jgi:hypothetical protein
MNKPELCIISPEPHLNDFCKDRNTHLLLAHLVETDEQYADWYKECDGYKILDNSAFEMYKQGRSMYDSDKLLEMGERTKADVIVMSDYPNEPSQLTIDAAEKLGPIFHDNGYKTFFVPQSRIGDMEDYLSAWEYAVNSPNVDFIGVSILGVPNAYGGIEKENKLQRFMSRHHMMHKLKTNGLLDKALENGKKLHFLGALDGWAGELLLVKPFWNYIFSWDSSGPVWYGLHANKTYDDSPTGQIEGKYEEEVDFNYQTTDVARIDKARYNISVLDNILQL